MTAERIFADTEALDMIVEHLSGEEWDSETIERVAEIVQLTGRTIDDFVPERDDVDLFVEAIEENGAVVLGIPDRLADSRDAVWVETGGAVWLLCPDRPFVPGSARASAWRGQRPSCPIMSTSEVSA